jgi:HK97 family phage prohead protease
MKLKEQIEPAVLRKLYRHAGETMDKKREDEERARTAIALADRLAHREKRMLGETKDIDEKQGIVAAMISTGGVDRDSEVVVPGAFKDSIPDFMKNPVVLWAHGHADPPIGKAIEMEDTPEGLRAVTQFAVKESPFAKMIFDLYAGGFLRAWSVGFIPKEYSEDAVADGQKGITHLKGELFEYSAVPVPSNREALTQMVKGVGLLSEQVGLAKKLTVALKEGRVLSTKNRATVEAALDALQELLARDDASRENRESFTPPPTIRRDPKVEAGIDEVIQALTAATGGFIRRRT